MQMPCSSKVENINHFLEDGHSYYNTCHSTNSGGTIIQKDMDIFIQRHIW